MRETRALNQDYLVSFNRNVSFKALNIITIYKLKAIFRQPRVCLKNELALAARRQGWTTEKMGDRKIKAVRHIRSHTLAVSINYSKSSFDIIYVGSNNLKFDGSNIHKNYNIWIHQLEESIQNEIEFRFPELR